MMAGLEAVRVELDAAVVTRLNDAVFALATLVEHVNALDRLPRQFHRDDWTVEELLESAREFREAAG